MKRSTIVAFVALCLSTLIGLPALAERPSINALNAAVNQLQNSVFRVHGCFVLQLMPRAAALSSGMRGPF